MSTLTEIKDQTNGDMTFFLWYGVGMKNLYGLMQTEYAQWQKKAVKAASKCWKMSGSKIVISLHKIFRRQCRNQTIRKKKNKPNGLFFFAVRIINWIFLKFREILCRFEILWIISEEIYKRLRMICYFCYSLVYSASITSSFLFSVLCEDEALSLDAVDCSSFWTAS